ncbi:hypothetical protein R3P38DRAFT_3189110 [Favolaschia claudopus]|uniref:Uncharacterized protein n=1 Tax=Favolaschia claudopus TaxID=2862362 RepID=A0AAW0BV97_9AGAR
MPKGKKTKLPADKTAYLESFWLEFTELQPHLGNFWIKVTRGWLQNWPVERRLGLPLVDSTGAAIGEDARSPQEALAIGQAIETENKVVCNWYNNRSQKEKKALNEATPASSSTGAVGEMIAALGASSRRPRHSQRRQIWEKRNKDVINAALRAEGFKELMGVGYEGETVEERKERISRGRSAQQTLRQKVVKRLQLEATAEEMAIVEELYKSQEKPSRDSTESARTPEDFQQGIDEVGPLLKQVHTYVQQKTGLVGSTMLVGPIPNLGGRIGTQTYCHGVTAAGHTFDQAHSGWEDHVVKPLHQFGKKVFDHQTRRERAIRTQESSEPDNTTHSNTEDQTETGGSPTLGDIPPSETPTSTTSENGPTSRLPTPPPISPVSEARPTASEPPSNTSPRRTGLFLPGEDEDFGRQDYPPLDLDLDYLPLSNETLSNSDVFSVPPNLAGTPGPTPLSMITDDTSSGDRAGDIIRSLSTTPAASGTPAPANAQPAAPPPAPALSGFTQNWVFPSYSAPSTHTSMPSTPTFDNLRRGAPASAPPPARPFGSATALLAAGSMSVPSTPSRAEGSVYGRPQTAFQRAGTANPLPLRHVFTAGSPSTPAAPAPSTTAPTGPETTPPVAATTTTPAPTALVLPSPHRHPAPPTTAEHAAPPVVSITTPARVLSALTADDFPESRPLSNAPKAPKAATPAGQGQGGGRGGGARGRGTRGRGGRGRGGGGGAGGGAGGGGADTGYLLGHDAEGGNRWQLGTVSRQHNLNREAAATAAAAQKKLDQAARDRDHGIFYFPPPPPGTTPLPAEPAALGARAPPPEPRILGLRGASERTVKAGYVAPKKRTMEDIRKDAMKKREQKEAEKLAAAAKRKADAENVRPGPSKKK